MDSFNKFLNENLHDIPNIMTWIHSFFDHGLDITSLKVLGDWLEENNFSDAAILFHSISDRWRSPKLKRGAWHGDLIHIFYNVFGFPGYQEYNINDSMNNSWFFHVSKIPETHPYYRYRGDTFHRMARPLVYPQMTSYRLSITNGKWFVYTNTHEDRVSVVSTRHNNPEQDELYYGERITIRNYTSIPVEQVPDLVLLQAFL